MTQSSLSEQATTVPFDKESNIGDAATLGSIAGQKGDYYGDHWVLLGAIGQIGRVVTFSWIAVNS